MTEIRPDVSHSSVDHHLQAFDHSADHFDTQAGQAIDYTWTSGYDLEKESLRSFEASRGLCEDEEEEETWNTSPEGHHDSSDDESSNLFNLEDGWEAPTIRPDLLDLEIDVEMVNPWDPQEVNSGANELNGDLHTHIALQQTQSKQMFVDKFPSDAAGRSVSTSESFTPDANQYYAEKLEGQVNASSRNPYWLFTLKLDWEVACWAKMRGPGSTVVSELLGINNVSQQIPYQYKLVNSQCLNLACKPSWSFIY